MDSSTDSTSSSEDELQECGSGDAKSKIDDLPAKSRERYLKVYECFNEWRTSKRFKSLSEFVFLEYFKELLKTKQASTLMSTYSMLRATVNANDGVQINTYPKLLKYLKTQVKNHLRTRKKFKVFTAQDVETFLNDAPDDIYLAIKVALIFGISGACHAFELIRIRPQDIQKHSDHAMLVNLMRTPTKIKRSFLIRDEYVKIVEKYQALRPSRMSIDRFFISYQHGKCTRQAIGKNTITSFTRKIATYLELPDVEMYSGRCLRNTSVVLGLAQSGANALMRQCVGRRSNISGAELLARSSNVAQRLRTDPYWRAYPAEGPRSESPGTPHPYSPDATQCFESPDATQCFESPINVSQLLKMQRCESPDGTQPVKMEWNESPDECRSVKSEDRFEQNSEEYVSQPPRPLYSAVRRLAALEQRRLKLDAARARQLHARETRRLRVRASQLEVDRDRTEVLRRIADVATAWLEKTANGVISRH